MINLKHQITIIVVFTYLKQLILLNQFTYLYFDDIFQ
jgi:hypothetical protein